MSVLEKVEEAVHRVDEALHHKHKEEANDIDGVDHKYVIYLNREVHSPVTGGHTEDKPVYQVTGAVIDYLEREDLITNFKDELIESKAAAKAYLNREFTFRKYYVKREDGVANFYEKNTSYPSANLISDLEYELEIER